MGTDRFIPTITATRIITVIMRTAATAMTDPSALYRLLAWLSPGYPVGAYTYSHGLENAVEAGFVTDSGTARGWIGDTVSFGAGFADTAFLAAAHRATSAGDTAGLADVAELAAAFPATRELALEAHAQGRAFLAITAEAWSTPALDDLRACWDGPCAYPVTVGCAAAGHGIALDDAASGYLHAFAANLVSAAVRLVPLGQTAGQQILAGLEDTVAQTAARALETEVEEAASATFMVDVCSMKHETQHTRLFRS